MKQNFFFYGTLLHEVESYLTKKLHEKLELVGEGFIIGKLFAIPWEGTYYPALVLDESGYRVCGNLYETRDSFAGEDLRVLDNYEEFYPDQEADSEYVRQEVLVNIGNDKRIANVYVYHKEVPNEATEVPAGEFMKFLKEI